MMSFLRSAKNNKPKRARRGVSLPGATLVILIASTALSFAIDDRQRDRSALEELVAARMVTDWARALDGHTLINRGAVSLALSGTPSIPFTLADIEANPNTPTWLVDPTGPSQPLAGWAVSFAVIIHFDLPTALLILSPPAATGRIAPSSLIASLARTINASSGDAALDATAARSAAQDAGIVLDQADIVLFAHEYAGLSKDRISRIARPGMVVASNVDLTFTNNDLVGIQNLSTASLTMSEMTTTSLSAPNITISSDLSSGSLTSATITGGDATLVGATTPFSIAGIVNGATLTTASLKSRFGDITAATTLLLGNNDTIEANSVDVTDTAQIPSIPPTALVTDLTTTRIFALTANLNTLTTDECPAC